MTATRRISRTSICKHISKAHTLMNESITVLGRTAPKVSLPLLDFGDTLLHTKAMRGLDAKTFRHARKPSASIKPYNAIFAPSISSSLPTHVDTSTLSPTKLANLALTDRRDFEDMKRLRMELLNSSVLIV